MAIDGTYNLTVNTPMGAQQSQVILKTEGNTLTGTQSGSSGVETIKDGKVSGNEAEWSIMTSTPFGPIKLEFKLTFSGNKVTGQAVTPFGPSPVEGTKA